MQGRVSGCLEPDVFMHFLLPKIHNTGMLWHEAALLALGATVIVAVIAFFSSVCSLLGSDDRGELMYFMTSNLQAEYCLEDD